MDISSIYRQGRKYRNYNYTRTGKPIFNTWSSDLYESNWLPPLKVLLEYESCGNIEYTKEVNGYYLEFWHGPDIEEFQDKAKSKLGDWYDRFLYVRKRHELESTTSAKPPMLNAYFKIGDICEEFKVDGEVCKMKILDSSARLETGQVNQRRTGYVVLELN